MLNQDSFSSPRAVFKISLVIIILGTIAIKPVMAAGAGFGPVESTLQELRGTIIDLLSAVLLIVIVLMIGEVGIVGNLRSTKRLLIAAISLVVLQGYDKFIKELVGTDPDNVGSGSELSGMIAPVNDLPTVFPQHSALTSSLTPGIGTLESGVTALQAGLATLPITI